jgi:hypothetical protein
VCLLNKTLLKYILHTEKITYKEGRGALPTLLMHLQDDNKDVHVRTLGVGYMIISL